MHSNSPHLSSYEAIIFDMDGVVLDSEPLHKKAQRAVLDRYGITIPPSASETFTGMTEADVFAHVAAHYAPGRVAASEMIAHKHREYASRIQELEMIPGALELICRLEALNIPLGLVTSATRQDQERAFSHFGLSKFFRKVVTVEDVTCPKPDPEPYLLMAQRLEVSPTRCLVIEDSAYGIRAAVQARCYVIGLATSFPVDVLPSFGCHEVVVSLADLETHLFADCAVTA